MSQTAVFLTFQDPAGNPLAGGSVVFRLSVDISTATNGGPQIAAGRDVKADLDSNGSCIVLLWPNDNLFPSGSVYFTTAYTAQGQPAWQDELTIATSTDAFLLQEDGSLFLLEDGTGALLLE